MPTFKINVDKAGNFYTKATLKLSDPDLSKSEREDKKLKLELLKPKDASIKVLTLTINKKTLNYAVSTGKSVTVGPFPISGGDNQISFEGSSDKPSQVHEAEVTLA